MARVSRFGSVIVAVLLLSLCAVAQHSVGLTWSENSPNDPAVKFLICRSLTQGSEMPCSNPLASTTGTTYTDTAVVSGTKYWYEVLAVDAGGLQSSPSNEVSALIPGPTPPVLNNPQTASSMPGKLGAEGDVVAKSDPEKVVFKGTTVQTFDAGKDGVLRVTVK